MLKAHLLWKVSRCKYRESIQSSTTPEQDTNGKVTNSQLDTTNDSQEVSPFPAGDHKARVNRRVQRHCKHKTEKHKISILVTNIEWENPQPIRHVVILTPVDMHLGQLGDAYL